jgi:hypothetical protein
MNTDQCFNKYNPAPGEETRKTRFEVEKEINVWYNLALWWGFNEMAKEAETIQERILCRIAREHALSDLVKLGVEVECGRDPVVVEMPSKRPWIELTTADYDLMRKALAEHDASK